MFTFTPLLGAQSSSSAVQSLLEFDGGIKILVDVGWDEAFDAERLRALERQVPTISLILLTHATVSHLGAYAHCCKHVPLFHQIPVYATEPVISLGRTLTQDLYNSTPLGASFLPRSALAESTYAISPIEPSDKSHILLPAPTSEEVAGYFSLINTLRYSQNHQPIASPFSPPADGLAITAYCAGHTLGGTIWHIQQGSESVVYAVDWHQARENALPGAAWLAGSGATGAEITEQLRRPTALICSSKGPGIVAPAGGLRKRDDLLLEQIRTTVRAGGSVLIPCDSSARALELAYTLERAWASDGKNQGNGSLQSAKLHLVSSTCESTTKEARRMLEWMDESIVAEFEANSGRQQQGRDGKQQDGQSPGSMPFAFKHLKLVERQSQLKRALASGGPKVFIASDASLEWGFSRSIIRQLADNSNSMILLVNPISADSRPTDDPRKLIDELSKLLRTSNLGSTAGKDTISYQCSNDTVSIQEVTTSALSGNDLGIYQQYLAQQRQRQNAFTTDTARNPESSADAVDEQSSSSSSSDEDSDAEHQGKVLNISAALAHSKHKLVQLTDEDLGVNVLLRRKNVYDYDVRGKKGREKMFPFVAKRRRVDDFGDLIRPEDYLRAEERDEVDGQDMAGNDHSKDETVLGQKRKWHEGDSKRQSAQRRSSSSMNKRRRVDGNNRVSGRGASTNDDAVEESSESEESEYEPEEAIFRGPLRATFTQQTLQLNLKITAIDFSGLHDRRSINMLMPLIRPRKLILTAGTEEETLSLAEDCRKLLASSGESATSASDVMTPTVGVSVDASVDTNAWTIKLSQSLYKQLRWQNFRGLGIVTLSGRLELPILAKADESSVKRQKLDDAGIADSTATQPSTNKPKPTLKIDPSLLPTLTELSSISTTAPTTSLSQNHSNTLPTTQHRPATNVALHVGDLRLAELRKIMQASGHTAEFKGEGTLLVDGVIAVRKSGIGRIEVESGGGGGGGGGSAGGSGAGGRLQEAGMGAGAGAGASFYDVKRRIYEGLAVVAAR